MKRYLIPLTALFIGVGMMGGDELETRRKEIPPRSVRMLQQAVKAPEGYEVNPKWIEEFMLHPDELWTNLIWLEKKVVEPVKPTNSIGFLRNMMDVIIIGPVLTNTNSVVCTLKCVGTNSQDYVDAAKYFKVMPNLVNLLATTGEVCKVRGHAWKFMPHMTLEAQYGPVEDRQCVVCGKHESRAMPAWPTP